ncbi:MAG: NAD(P)-binding protein [Acidobacteriota bacterium]
MDTQEGKNDVRVGVYLCHCGTNIYPKVRVDSLSDDFNGQGNVTVARNYKYMCSDLGQDLIKKDIKELGLNRVIVASCSPSLHEVTFRRACKEGGLNPFLFQMANIREHCSWVTEESKEATDKARRIINAAINRVIWHEAMEYIRVPINPDVLVVGGGITGIEAALRLDGSGRKVYLLDREPSIGGHMADLDKTFPTLDCAACILTPKMGEIKSREGIELLSYSEVKEVSGYVGSYKVKVLKKPRFVDLEKCTGCGVCWNNCPVFITPSKRVIAKGKLVIKEKNA